MGPSNEGGFIQSPLGVIWVALRMLVMKLLGPLLGHLLALGASFEAPHVKSAKGLHVKPMASFKAPHHMALLEAHGRLRMKPLNF